MDVLGNGWAVARTILSQENKAQASLQTAGFESYSPKYLWVFALQGRTINRARVLFPGYIFFKLISEEWKRIFHLDYISGLLMSGERPASVSQDIIDELRSREGSDGLIRLPDKSERIRFYNGQGIRAKLGALMDLEGTFLKGIGGDRVKVAFNILGSEREVVMRVDEIEAVEGIVKRRSINGRRKRYYSRNRSYPLQLGA